MKRDNILRPDYSIEKLATLKPAFDKTSGRGTLTAGNSTPLTDGAAAVLLGSVIYPTLIQPLFNKLLDEVEKRKKIMQKEEVAAI